MGMTKRWIHELEEERKTKQELLPAQIESLHDIISEQADIIMRQSEKINTINQEVAASNSLKSKIKDYLYGGAIGAIIGAALTYIIP